MTSPNGNGRRWTDTQVSLFVRQVRREFGTIWWGLTVRLRRALLAERALRAIIEVSKHTQVPSTAMRNLLQRMVIHDNTDTRTR